VLGSGLGDFADHLANPVTIPYSDIPHFPASRVIGHAGKLVAGELAGKKVLALSGRVHVYEGHDMQTVTFAVRTIGRLGVPRVILTNAAGGISPNCARGALMVIDDHINFMGQNPLVGANDERFGLRFPDMTYVYSKLLRAITDETAKAIGVPVQHGVYIGVLGPSYETPAEIRAFRTLGANAVGMSTVPEAIALRHMGVEVLGISCITNAAAGVFPEPLHHSEVMETAQQVKGQFIALLEGIIARL
jgi:purine-nucleoside phosphorylase